MFQIAKLTQSGRRVSTAVAIACALAISACKTAPVAPGDATTVSAQTVAAADFASKLQNTISPDSLDHAFYLSAPGTAFGRSLTDELTKAGFDVAPGPGNNAELVEYEISSLETTDGTSSEYRVMIGDLAMIRNYLTDDSGTYPATPLTTEIAGAGSSNAVQVAAQAPAAPAPAPVVINDPVAADLPEDLESVKRSNMYKTRKSNFGDYVLGYDGVYKQILDFPNDSLKLTPETVKELEAISSMYKDGTDVVSVIGCSHGDTELDNGNALLAIGRSKRVRYFLADLGVPENRILDEGCWAPVHFDEAMPRRGVVIELKRKPS